MNNAVTKAFALVSFLAAVGACHGTSNAKPTAERAERAERAEAKDDDDKDDVKSPVGQNAVPATPTPPPVAAGPMHATTFDSDNVGAAPVGFTFGRTGQGADGKWVVKAESGAPSGANVLAQLDADDTDYRFPVAIADGPSLADLRLEVKCRPVSGKVDQGCGLIFRVVDVDNYYVTRANALENNVRLYHVVNGKRVQFAGWNGTVASGDWHDLRVDAKGEHFEVYFDGRKIVDASDPTFKKPGKVGLWTKADSVIYFDDLTVTPL